MQSHVMVSIGLHTRRPGSSRKGYIQKNLEFTNVKKQICDLICPDLLELSAGTVWDNCPSTDMYSIPAAGHWRSP